MITEAKRLVSTSKSCRVSARLCATRSCAWRPRSATIRPVSGIGSRAGAAATTARENGCDPRVVAARLIHAVTINHSIQAFSGPGELAMQLHFSTAPAAARPRKVLVRLLAKRPTASRRASRFQTPAPFAPSPAGRSRANLRCSISKLGLERSGAPLPTSPRTDRGFLRSPIRRPVIWRAGPRSTPVDLSSRAQRFFA